MSTVVLNGQVDRRTFTKILRRFSSEQYFVSHETESTPLERVAILSLRASVVKLRPIYREDDTISYRIVRE